MPRFSSRFLSLSQTDQPSPQVNDNIPLSKKFIAPGKRYPIIPIVDNDRGARSIFNTIKDITGQKPSGREPFVHVVSNLYIIATPLKSGAKESKIEDFFDAKIKTTKIKGKNFPPAINLILKKTMEK